MLVIFLLLSIIFIIVVSALGFHSTLFENLEFLIRTVIPKRRLNLKNMKG